MEVTPDMLPDTQPESPETPSQTVSQDVNTQSEAPGTEDTPAAPEPKVSNSVPYSRFKEVNERNKELEEQLKALQVSEAPEEVIEEPNPLEDKVTKLEREIYLNRFPDLTDKRDELEAFLEEKSGMDLKDAVTLFRAEHGLVGQARKGLEKTTAGPKTAPAPRFTLEEIETMRVNNPDKWMKHNLAGDFDGIAEW